MAANFFLLDPSGYYVEFDNSYETSGWVPEDGTVAITLDQDAVNNEDHPSCMKIISTTDGKGGYIDVTTTAELECVVEFNYKMDATQEIDWVIYDQTNAANIAIGTLVKSADWYGFYRRITTPAACVTIRLYLRAGTATGETFFIDDIGCRGNLILEDAESELYIRSFSRQSNLHNMQRGNAVQDSTPPRMSFPLTWKYLTNSQFSELIKFVRSNSVAYFDDGNLPDCVELQNVYTETQYTFSGITNPSGTHVAYYDTDTDLPNDETNFETTEFSTVNYQAIDANDSNSVDTSITTTSNIKKYIYHKFQFDLSPTYVAINDIQRMKIKYVGECDDASSNDVDGVVVYVWHNSNWLRIGESTSKDATTIDYVTDEPVQAQDFVDIADQTITIIVRSRGHKGSDGNLTMKSHYLSVWVNQDMGSGVALSNEFTLDAGGDVVEVKNLTDDAVLVLDTDYVIGDGRDNLKAMSEDEGDLIQVTYKPRIAVAMSGTAGDRWWGTSTPATPPREVTITLQSLNALTEL